MTIWDDRSRMNRREALELLGLAAGAGLLSSLGVESATAAETGGAIPSTGQEAIIRTILRDIPADELPDGAVLMHEHLSIHYPLNVTEHFTDDVGLMTSEVEAAAADGVALIVDAGHPDMSRNLDALRRITTESGMPIVASGGYYMQRSYPPEIASMSAEQIARTLADDATRNRLGAFGEIGQQGGELTADEQKVFEAVGQAQALTGLPVFTHNPYRGKRGGVPTDAALRQLDALVAGGGDPANIAIGHVCCLDDPAAEVAIEIARRGAFVAFDRVTLEAIMPDADRVTMAMALIDAGYPDRLLLSSDFYSANSLKSNGGAGLAQTVTAFAPMLLDAGLPEATLRQILDDNPRRFLSFVPKA